VGVCVSARARACVCVGLYEVSSKLTRALAHVKQEGGEEKKKKEKPAAAAAPAAPEAPTADQPEFTKLEMKVMCVCVFVCVCVC
jgi:hypothetical protein